MRLLRLIAPGIIGLVLVAGFRLGVDGVADYVAGPAPAAAVPYAPASKTDRQAQAPQTTAGPLAQR